MNPATTITDHKSPSSPQNHPHYIRLISHPLYPYPPPRSGTFVNGKFQEQQSHFLDTCFLCKKPIGFNRDIYMYRGDVPFCSVECRSEQIEMDETKVKKRNLSASIKALRKKEETEKSSSNNSPNYPFDSGAAVIAA